MAISKELDLETSIGFGRKRDNELIILSQKKDMVINYNDVFAIKVQGSKILALGNGNEYTIGNYKDDERAGEVLFDLISRIGLEPMYQLPRE